MSRVPQKLWINNIPERFEKSKFQSQRELADAIREELQKENPGYSFTPSYMCHILQQKSNPSYEVRKAIAAVFGCSVEELDK